MDNVSDADRARLVAIIASAFLQYVPWAGFSAMRVFALSSKNRPLALVVLLLSSGPIVVDFVHLGYSTFVQDAYECGFVPGLSIMVKNILMVLEVTIIARGGLMMADILVLAITWRATRATLKAGRDIRALGQATSLSAILFQYGEMLLAINILHLVLTLLSTFQDVQRSRVTLLSEPLTAILVSRFLLDLQKANNAMAHQESLASISSLNFHSRFIGSLGSSLPVPDFTFTSRSICNNDGNENGSEKHNDDVATGIVPMSSR
ncbi:hypothetical protein C8Q76DRAFT_719563 [Earliella scabrosa]|nr:hypothetical protein C8Q76DRAFT_719563 [Earliella scabrosa]